MGAKLPECDSEHSFPSGEPRLMSGAVHSLPIYALLALSGTILIFWFGWGLLRCRVVINVHI